jgi:hypothetical protein
MTNALLLVTVPGIVAVALAVDAGALFTVAMTKMRRR